MVNSREENIHGSLDGTPHFFGVVGDGVERLN